MSAPLCRCQHGREAHAEPGLAPQCVASGCTCIRYWPATAAVQPATSTRTSATRPSAPVSTRLCNKCGKTKPAEEFYRRHTDGSSAKRTPCCRDCDNVRPRTRTVSRVVRVRARHRAVAELIRRHDPEFRRLLDHYTDEAAIEAERLAEVAAAKAEEHAEEHPAPPTVIQPAEPASIAPAAETPRLRSGPRRPGQIVEDRLDVARCSECVRHHDTGHACPNCGAQPQAAAS